MSAVLTDFTIGTSNIVFLDAVKIYIVHSLRCCYTEVL